jgi:hypothetical protein
MTSASGRQAMMVSGDTAIRLKKLATYAAVAAAALMIVLKVCAWVVT